MVKFFLVHLTRVALLLVLLGACGSSGGFPDDPSLPDDKFGLFIGIDTYPLMKGMDLRDSRSTPWVVIAYSGHGSYVADQDNDEEDGRDETWVAADSTLQDGRNDLRDDDLERLCRLARHKQTCVKISAFYALGAKQPPYLDLVPMIRRVFEAFGPQRLMWGSDSPYQLRGGHSYSASIELIRDRLGFTPEDREWLLGNTAERVFFEPE